MRTISAVTATVLAVLVLSGVAAVSADAQTRHHHRRAARASMSLQAQPYAERPVVTVRDRDPFYPNEIEGGVSGNLSFNNQLRKHSDPLNANGGGG